VNQRFPDLEGATLLCCACAMNYLAVARLLLENGAEVNLAMNDGASPLYLACENGLVDVASLLLQTARAST